jgi:oligoendopeptidase F
LKARLLELPKLALYDQYAPVGQEAKSFQYGQAKEVILDAFGASSQISELASEFFAKNWIDAEIRKGKRGGAFCASPSPQLHPYILCNYDDNLRDVMTVAHELGHGMHGCLSRAQNISTTTHRSQRQKLRRSSLRMLVFDYLLRQQPIRRYR